MAGGRVTWGRVTWACGGRLDVVRLANHMIQM